MIKGGQFLIVLFEVYLIGAGVYILDNYIQDLDFLFGVGSIFLGIVLMLVTISDRFLSKKDLEQTIRETVAEKESFRDKLFIWYGLFSIYSMMLLAFSPLLVYPYFRSSAYWKVMFDSLTTLRELTFIPVILLSAFLFVIMLFLRLFFWGKDRVKVFYGN